jgi:hypothetical protein
VRLDLLVYWGGGGGVQLGPLGTTATNSLLCQPRVIMIMEKLVETEVLGENLPHCRFVQQKPHMLPGREPGPRGGKPATNRLSYGTAWAWSYQYRVLKLRVVLKLENIWTF